MSAEIKRRIPYETDPIKAAITASERYEKDSPLLANAFKTFAGNHQQLLESNEGRWVGIFNHDLVGVFDTQQDAINTMYRTIGNVPMLVKRIQREEDPPVFISSLSATPATIN